MIQLTRRDLEYAYEKVASANNALKGHRQRGEEIAKNAITGLEVLAGAAAAGAAMGYFGSPHLMLGKVALPFDALTGAGLHALAFFDLFGKYSEHVHNVANGTLAPWVARMFEEYGRKMKAPAAPTTAGASAARYTGAPSMVGRQDLYRGAPAMVGQGRRPLTAAELAAIAARSR